MKILFVSDSYYPHINGVYYFVRRIGPMLQNAGHEVAVIAPATSATPTERTIDGLKVYGMPSLSVVFYPSIRAPIPFLLKSRISKIIENFKPDIIHLQDHFTICSALVTANKKFNVPIIGTNHLMAENFTVFVRSKKLQQLIVRFLWNGFSKVYNQVKLVTTPTEFGVGVIKDKLKVPVIAISSGIDLEKWTPLGDTVPIRKKYNLGDKPVLLYVGRIDPEKHIEEILQAVAMALKITDFYFVIVGKGISKVMLEKRAEELGISANVLFTGFVPDEDLPFFYKLSRCFVIASIAELLSLATLQAMASGLPVIAVRAGALVELVHNNQNGYLYNEGDVSALAKNIENIFTDDEVCTQMGEKSLEYVQEHDIRKTLGAFEKLYHNIINKNSKAFTKVVYNQDMTTLS